MIPIITYIKMAGALALVLLLGAAFFYVHHLKEQATKVPVLQQQVTDLQKARARDDADAQKAALQIVANMAAEQVSLRDFNNWKSLALNLNKEIGGIVKNAKANQDPGCFPSNDDRKLWNSTVAKLTTQ